MRAARAVSSARALIGRDTHEARDGAQSRPSSLPPQHRSDAKVLIDNPLTGIEIALWDIAAREAGVPLYELLGGACRTEVAFSEYFAYRPGLEDSPADVAAFCARMVEEHDSRVFEGKVAVRPVERGRRARARDPSGHRPRSRAPARRQHGLAARDRAAGALAARAVRHRERRGAGGVVRRDGGAASLDRDPVLGAHSGRRAGSGTRSPRHARHRPRFLRRHRRDSSVHRRLRARRCRLLVLQRRLRDRDGRVPAHRRRDSVRRAARASRCCAGRPTT